MPKVVSEPGTGATDKNNLEPVFVEPAIIEVEVIEDDIVVDED